MSEKPTYDDIEEVVSELVIPFYHIERDMVIPGTIRRDETDAEHSWSLAFLACSIASQIDPELDLGLIAQLAIVHDIPEVYASDISVWDSADKLAKKKQNEVAAQQSIAERFSHLPWISSTIETYERQDTKEAKFVYALDKLIALVIRRIDKGQAYIDKQLTKGAFLAGLTPSRNKAQTYPEIGKYFEELWAIFESHPEYFYRSQD
ncbi:MAG TPA: HD domain-containing protein [Candidatus Saccharimonadales bacterium]|nr:HD domain-containing protein [Candidatus Saccharimonadales bacterium]